MKASKTDVRGAIADGLVVVVSSGSSRVQRKRLHLVGCQHVKPTSRPAQPSSIVNYERSNCSCLGEL